MNRIELRDVTKVFPAEVGGERLDRPAVDAVSLRFDPGSATALVGANGAGKSTLLKLVAGILAPSSGAVHRPRRCAALIELGGGFHPDLTAQENLELGLSLAGYSRRSRRSRMADAIEFAGIGDAMDRQAKHLSTGMLGRLACAVAVHTEPDALLVDEVLAVGDSAFQRNMLSRVDELVRDGTVLVLVTHSLELAAVTTTRTVWLRDGAVHDDGHTPDVLSRYEAAVRGWGRTFDREAIQIERVELVPARINPGGPLRVTADLRCTDAVEATEIRLDVRPAVGEDRVWMRSVDESYEDRQANLLAYTEPISLGPLEPGHHRVELSLGSVPVSSSRLEVSVVLTDRHHRVLDDVSGDLDVGEVPLRPHFHLEAASLAVGDPSVPVDGPLRRGHDLGRAVDEPVDREQLLE